MRERTFYFILFYLFAKWREDIEFYSKKERKKGSLLFFGAELKKVYLKEGPFGNYMLGHYIGAACKLTKPTWPKLKTNKAHRGLIFSRREIRMMKTD